MNDNTIVKLFSNCIPVKGARRSIICDLFYQKYTFIPNALFEILTEHKNETIGDIKEAYAHKHDNIIDEYFNEILNQELGFECAKDEVFNYPDLSLDWERPQLITNAIMDIDPCNLYDIQKAAAELDTVGCKALQIRIFKDAGISFLNTILHCFEYTSILHIELLLIYNENIGEADFVALCNTYKRINAIAFHSSPFKIVKEINQSGVVISYIPDKVESSSHCGIINPSLFNVSKENFLESLKYNSCLNKKISIDSCGDIKNCPSMTKSYGHISTHGFKEVLQQNGFDDLWKVTKDQVNVCSSCEFRYICTDCRVYVHEGQFPYNKPLKCGYDPFKAKWA